MDKQSRKLYKTYTFNGEFVFFRWQLFEYKRDRTEKLIVKVRRKCVDIYSKYKLKTFVDF